MKGLAQLLTSHRDLLYMLTWRDIRIKYKQTVMGFLWAILMPLLIVAAGLLVKLGLSRVSGEPLELSSVLSVAVKALPWSFFIASIRFATVSLTNNIHLVTKIAFPRAVFPVSAVLSQLFDFFVASTLVVILLVAAGPGASATLLWVPFLLTLLFVLAIDLSLLLAAANLFFRDVKHIVEVLVTVAIFFTPVFYEVEMFGTWGSLLMLNPVAPILEGLNDCIVDQTAPPLLWIAYSTGFGLLGLVVAPALFQRLEPLFAESI